MAKAQKSIRQQQVNKGAGQSFEQHESFDDSLLPDSLEIARLKEIDPDIMNWLKERTAKEQDARLDFNDRRMGLLEGGQKKAFAIDIFSLVFAFLIIICGMCFSALLIYNGESVIGTWFAGGTLVIAVSAFLNFRKKQSSNPNRK